MKRTLYKFIGCALLLASSVMNSNAANGIIETRDYKICPGDTIVMDTRRTVVFSDTILYDTILVTDPTVDSVYQYIVNVYPRFEKSEYKELEEGQTLTWCGMTITEAGSYERHFQSIHGCDSIHRLEVTLVQTSHPLVEIDTLFTLCEEESVRFNGKTYINSGEYEDRYTRDTVYKITIVKHPTQLHLQTGTMGINPYYWQYMLDGESKTDTLYQPGTYEYTTHNETTGCNDIWRLVLTHDESSYHFVETLTICENEPFEWRGRTNLNRTGIGQTTHYYDRYRTTADQDSIYELVLTVRPIQRSSRTIHFCGSVQWSGETYTESTTKVDTLQSIQYQCDSIITTFLVKGIPFVHHDTATIKPGESIEWRGQTITHDGEYEDRYVSTSGCDSIYSLGVGLKADAPVTNTHTWYHTLCEGDYYEWLGQKYFNAGTFIDTVFAPGTTDVIDSLNILHLTVHPKYALTERVTFLTFPQTYREQVIPAPGTYTFHYHSSLGCDSIVTSYIDQEVYRDEQTVVICPGDTHIWDYDGETYSVTGKYTKTEQDKNGNDSVIHVLNLTVRYIPEMPIEETICQGQTFVFGDRSLTESGVYKHTYHVAGGCDSTVVLSLNVLRPDTTYLAVQREQGAIYQWGTETIYEPGMYFQYGINRFGCDSVSILQFTYNQVDTIKEKVTVCPNELPYTWNGIEGNQTKVYTKTVQEPNGHYSYYVLDLTVREVTQRDTTLAICEGGSIVYNGVTYTEAGHYRSYLSCDTLMNVHIVFHQSVVYETRGTITDDHGFTWNYINNGTPGTQVYTTPGTYEFENPNPETGCNDIYRLILTKDETSYHFEESQTICEGDAFEWQGMQNLSSVTGTNTYEVKYETRTGQDSIYTLQLTVIPIERTVRTVVFCGETTWKGTTYTGSAVVYDTIATATGCYRIERINLDKETPFYHSESKELPQGTVLHWHGQNITTDGTYYDYNTTVNGCDSTYQITVTIIPASPETNQYAEELSTCEGDTIVWRGKDIWRSGTYVDTVYKAGTENIDSIFTLHFTAWPAPKDTIYQHLYTCGAGASIRYQGKDYYTDQTVVENLKTIHGCDSIVKVFLHFNTALFLSDTVEIADTQLPYRWSYRLSDATADTVLTQAGTYTHRTEAEGSCTNQEQLVLIVYPTYLYELDTTICEVDLPFEWRGKSLQHTIGETKQYEDRFNTVNNTDSIYRLNLTIAEAPRRTEQHYVCSSKPEKINGKWYGDSSMPADMMYRDTIKDRHSDGVCDSIIYLEIYVSSVRESYETRILHYDEAPIVWNGLTITDGGLYHDTTANVGFAGCDSISTLHVVKEQRWPVSMCALEGPYNWRGKDYSTTGLWTDTVFDNVTGDITEFHTLQLTIDIPRDTTIYLRGCYTEGEEPRGVTWHDKTYFHNTVFEDTVACEMLYRVHVEIDTAYTIEKIDTICEQYLPYILGSQNPDTIWGECVRFPHKDTTACGCDSLIYLTLRIIPDLKKSDSTFVCEEYFTNGGVVTLGNLTDPWFEYRENGKYSGKWQGKWKGIDYHNDTIVYNCDSSYFHHIIVRPHQTHIPEMTYALCKGDSVQLFWPHDTRWIKEPGVYYDTVPTISAWLDTKHNTYIHNDRAYECDSVTKWTVVYTDTLHEHLYAHIRQGETYVFNDSILSTTGVYDSIGDYISSMDSAHHFCKAVYSLHLTVDPIVAYQDTIEICHIANREYTYTFVNDDLAEHFAFKFQTPEQDTAILHFSDSLKHLSYEFYDHYYDLVVYYKQQYFLQIKDTLCYGDSIQFDRHSYDAENNATVERYLREPGIYVDTLQALNGCDSIIELHLELRERVITAPQNALVTDRDLPYLWSNTWREPGAGQDTTHTDSLYVTGDYTYTMPNRFGCDSTVVMHFEVHPTHVFRDSINICALKETTHTHFWNTGYQQTFTVPATDDTITYADTLTTRYPLDSIYVLLVNYHEQTITYLDSNICYGDSIQFGLTRSNTPRFLNQSGVYNDTLVRIGNGCDSIIVLRLNVFPRYFNDYTHHISSADTPYVWIHMQDGHEIARDSIYAEGNYEFTYNNNYGCDSIDSLHLFIHQNYLYRDTVQICASETPYAWGDKKDIYHTGEYIQYFRTHDDQADSTHVRYIKVMPVKHDSITMTICEGDSLRFGLTNDHQPRWLYHNGIYNDTMTTRHGCDSIITLTLNVLPRYYNHTTVHIADTDTPYVWIHEQGGVEVARDTLYANGRYGYLFHSQYACDSIDSLTLVVHPTYLFEDTVTICSSETPYIWFDKQDIYETGSYIKRFQTHDGYDSTYVRYIHVLPVKRTEIHDSICEGEDNFYLFKGQKLTQSCVLTDTLIAANGCDSIVTLHLTVNKPYYSFREEHIIEGQTVVAYGKTFTTDTVYIQKGLTANGCDSTTVLKVVVHPMVDTVVTVCSSELPYQWVNKWNGQVTPLYAAGLYRNDTTYVGGKQMFYGLQLVVNEPTDTTIYREICEGDLYNFNNRFLGTSGEYRDTIRNISGCDSVIILHLNVLQKFHNIVDRTIFEGDTVHFEGHTYNKSGSYPVRYTTSYGCDSIIELRLTVNRLFDDSITICTNELPYRWQLMSDPTQYMTIYESGIYRDTVTNTESMKTTIGLKVNVLPISYAQAPIVATICEGDVYRWRNEMLSVSGTYYDTLTAASGCDSVVMLSLQVMPVEHQTANRTIFEGDTVVFFGQTYTESGIYTHNDTTEYGCTNTHQLVLTVLKEEKIDTTAYICEYDLPFRWNGFEFNQTGNYDIPTKWTDSSRVVTTLHLVVREAPYRELNVSLCYGNSFIVNRDTITQSGVYDYTIPSQFGCDSTVRYIVSVHNRFERWDTAHISDKESYEFPANDGTMRYLTVPGDYEYTGKTKETLCDSIIHLYLVVHPSYLFTESLEICKSDTNYPFEWKDEKDSLIATIYESGTYFNKHLTTKYGFDSIYELKVTVYDSYYTEEQHEIGEGEQLKIHGQIITQPGIYNSTLLSIHGCDSIFKIIVNPRQTREYTIRETICQGETYVFFDQYLSQGGYYKHVSDDGYTITHLYLTVSNKDLVKKDIVVAPEDFPYPYNGNFYDTEGLYTENLINRNGCDSIVKLNIIKTDHASPWYQIPLCKGETLTINNEQITQAGQYVFLRRSSVETGSKMDSLYRIEVYEATKYEFPPVRETICDGDSIFFDNTYYKYEGVYRIPHKSVDGCDSIITLELTVIPTTHTHTYATIYQDYSPYIWSRTGLAYNTSGEYVYSWQNQSGQCYNTETLHLTITHPDTVSMVICNGDTLTWHNMQFTEKGMYEDITYDENHMIVDVDVLNLRVAYPTDIKWARADDVCADADSMYIEFDYKGETPTLYSIYFDAAAKREGFQDVIDKPFSANHHIASVGLPGGTLAFTDSTGVHHSYIKPNYYTMQFELNNGACGLVQSSPIKFLVKYPSWIIQQNWDDVVAPLKPELNGGFEFSTVEWEVYNSEGVVVYKRQGNTLGYLHYDGLREGDEVVMYATRKGESFAIETCPITIEERGNFNPYPTIDNPILVAPTQAPRHLPVVNVTSTHGGQYEIFSFTGTLIERGSLIEGTMPVTLPSVNGIYFIRTSYGEECTTHKILIY